MYFFSTWHPLAVVRKINLIRCHKTLCFFVFLFSLGMFHKISSSRQDSQVSMVESVNGTYKYLWKCNEFVSNFRSIRSQFWTFQINLRLNVWNVTMESFDKQTEITSRPVTIIQQPNHYRLKASVFGKSIDQSKYLLYARKYNYIRSCVCTYNLENKCVRLCCV